MVILKVRLKNMLINKLDNVEVDVTSGHKYAITDIKKGENIKVLYKTKNAHAIVVKVLGRKIALSKSVAQNVEVY